MHLFRFPENADQLRVQRTVSDSSRSTIKNRTIGVLRFEDPQIPVEIDSVFVTVEPTGGTLKPRTVKSFARTSRFRIVNQPYPRLLTTEVSRNRSLPHHC